MRVPAAVYLTLGTCVALGATVSDSASAQVPTAESQPRVAVPARGAVIQTAAPTEAATPAAQPAGQPTAAPAAAEPAPVTALTAPAPGVTTVPAPSPATASSSQAAMAARSYVAGKSALMLDGGPGGWLKAVEGGGISADVVSEAGSAKKHIGGPKFENISLQVGWEARPLLDWVAASWKAGPQRKNGAVSYLDYDYKERSAREFTNAVVTETTFPTIDAGSKDPLYLTVKIAPEASRLVAGSGAVAQSTPKAAQSKAWLPANVRFEMSGVDVTKVSGIESFTVGQHVTEHAVGEQRVSQKEPGGIEFPSLKISIAEANAQTWIDWSEDFIVKGNNGDDKEKNGAIVFLDSSLKSELGRVNLLNCGIAGLGPERQVTNAEAVRKVIAEVYCERMELVPSGKSD